jgi:hypothetical protein
MSKDTEKPRGSHIEAMAAATAIVVSVASLYVSLRQTVTMERQLEASVWPSLAFDTNDAVDGKPEIALSVKNGGIGPARVRSFEVSYHGKPVDGAVALLEECCGLGQHPQDAPFIDITFIDGRIIPVGQTLTFLDLRLPSEDDAVWKQLDRVRFEVDGQICYCSALDQCWSVGFHDREPAPVHDCVAASQRPQYLH